MAEGTRDEAESVPPRSVWSVLRYETGHFVAPLVMALGFRLRVDGRRHVPRRGPVLLVANHQSYLDPVLVGLACPRRLHYLARKTLFRNPFFTWLIQSF